MTDKLVFGTKTMGVFSISVVSVSIRGKNLVISVVSRYKYPLMNYFFIIFSSYDKRVLMVAAVADIPFMIVVFWAPLNRKAGINSPSAAIALSFSKIGQAMPITSLVFL